MIEKVKDSVIWELEKRFKNPFLWAFIISWIFFNWDVIYIILFLDEQYVSILPDAKNLTDAFITKFEYVNQSSHINLWKSFLNPLWVSFLFVIFVEWGLSYLNIQLVRVKNWINKKELLTKDESNKLKDQLVQDKIDSNTLIAWKNEEILSLTWEIKEIKLKINDKVNERIKDQEKLNLRRIKELEKNLDTANKLASDRFEEKKILEINLKKLEEENKKMFWVYDKSLKNLKSITNEKLELEQRLEFLDKPLDDTYSEEYSEFKKNNLFSVFGDLIDIIESESYNLWNIISSKEIKYLKIKDIITDIEFDWNHWEHYYGFTFTAKWNKFVELFLDDQLWWNVKWVRKKIKPKENEITIEDIPF